MCVCARARARPCVRIAIKKDKQVLIFYFFYFFAANLPAVLQLQKREAESVTAELLLQGVYLQQSV